MFGDADSSYLRTPAHLKMKARALQQVCIGTGVAAVESMSSVNSQLEKGLFKSIWYREPPPPSTLDTTHVQHEAKNGLYLRELYRCASQLHRRGGNQGDEQLRHSDVRVASCFRRAFFGIVSACWLACYH
jgi:hypothetical protein